MLLKEEINKYLNYCKFQKELDDKTIKAYKADLEQFITVIGENNPDKEMLNEYYGAAEPPVRCGESHLSGLTEPLRSL